jgi:hypothetical protein
VSDDKPDETAPSAKAPVCSACGTSATAGDRFCAQCGALLTGQESEVTNDDASTDLRPPSPDPLLAARDTRAWIFGARPGSVISAGILLLLLGAALLLIGQRDDTGTIVMLSICIAPLALLTIAIGIARGIASALGRG